MMNIEVVTKKSKSQSHNPPLLFIHGAAGGAWYFEYFLEYFSQEGFDSYALSLRGHGKSEGVEFIDEYGLDTYVEDVKHVIDTYKLKPILIGHSMGGAIVQKYVSLYPTTIQGMICLASAQAGGIDNESPLGLFFSDARLFLRSYRMKHPEQKVSLENIMNETIFSNRFSEEALAEIKKQLSKESSKVKKDLLKPFFSKPFDLKIPVAVIGSYGDHIVNENSTKITAKAFGVDPIMIPRLCHFMTIDPEWKVAADAILQWLKSHFS